MGAAPPLPPITWTPFVDHNGNLTVAALNVIQQIWSAAFGGANVVPGVCLLGYADDVNFNRTGDTQIALTLPPGAVGWRAAAGTVFGTSGTFSTAKAGLYSAGFQQGTTVLTQTALSAITATGFNAANATASLTPNSTTIWSFKSIFLNVGTAQGGASQGNFYLYGYPVF